MDNFGVDVKLFYSWCLTSPMSLLDKLSAQLPFKKKEPPREYFVALTLTASEVVVVLCQLLNHSVEILGQSSASYSSEDELLKKISQSLDEVVGSSGIEPKKVLFGVPDNWSLGDDLQDEYLKLLHKIAGEFELLPLAYVSVTQAVSNFLRKSSGVPPTALLLGIDGSLSLAVLRGGKVIESKVAFLGENLWTDIEQLLLQFKEVEVLPSKIVLYNLGQPKDPLDKLKDELLSFPWTKNLPFIHFPKVEVVEKDLGVWAVALAGAEELDQEVHFQISSPVKESSGVSKTLSKEGSDFGFIAGDVAERAPKEKAVADETLEAEKIEEWEEKEEREEKKSSQLSVPDEVRGGGFSPVSGLAEEVRSKFTHFVPPWSNFKMGRWLSFRMVALGAVLVGVIGTYFLMVKAEVHIFVEPRVLIKDAEVVADPTASSVDEDKKIIPGTVVETKVDGSTKGQATGKKLIGDPAKGQVAIYNKTDASKVLSSGTVLVSPANLKFTLDTTMTVASQSAVRGGISFGRGTASAVALSIGPESNLPAGVELTVGNFPKSAVSAEVDQAFSGGTSKSVTVVAADDQKRLEVQFADELKRKAVESLLNKIGNSKKIVPDALMIADKKLTFSKRINDQANEFSISGSVSFKGTAYQDSDLKLIVAKLVEYSVPENFELNLADTESQADITKVEKDGKLVFLARFKAKLMPKLDIFSLKKKLKGRSVEEAAKILRQVDYVIGSSIKLTPNLPQPLARLPLLGRNITIAVSPK